MKTIVIIFALVQLPDAPAPILYERQVTSLADCMRELKDFLQLPSNVVLQQGGFIQGGCRLIIPPPDEH